MIQNRLAKSLELLRDVLRLLHYSDRRLAVLVLLATIVETTLAIGALLAIKLLIDMMTRNPTLELVDSVAHVAMPLGTIALLLVLARMFQSTAAYLKQKQSLLVADVVNSEIQKRTCEVDQSFFDGAMYFDALQRAREAGPQRPAMVTSNAIDALRNAVLLVGIGVVLAGLDWRLLPGIAVAAVLALVVQLAATGRNFRWMRKRVQLERRAGYLDWLLTSELFSKELRLFNAGAFFRGMYRRIRETIRAEQLAIERLKARREAILALLAGFVFVGSSLLLLASFSTGTGTIGDLVLFVILFQRAETSGRAAAQSFSRLYDDQLFLGQLFEFLKLEPRIVASSNPATIPVRGDEGLRVENVSFRYARSEALALEDISLRIPQGQFVALVGGNGSGKSTLIKLLCRLYDPEHGQILLEGRDIRGFDPSMYRHEFGVVFQDFVRYADSASENIRLGDVRAGQGTDRIFEAARLAEADEFIRRLPHGYDTMLSRMFDDGEELSGGQWQRVALARLFFPDARFLILDEPTSSIDAVAEERLFRNFKEKLAGRGALVISHRLSTIRRADYTYVLERGRIVEQGTHAQLLRDRGQYYRMFEAQMSSFDTHLHEE